VESTALALQLLCIVQVVEEGYQCLLTHWLQQQNKWEINQGVCSLGHIDSGTSYSLLNFPWQRHPGHAISPWLSRRLLFDCVVDLVQTLALSWVLAHVSFMTWYMWQIKMLCCTWTKWLPVQDQLLIFLVFSVTWVKERFSVVLILVFNISWYPCLVWTYGISWTYGIRYMSL
jgi:hypothetical protein